MGLDSQAISVCIQCIKIIKYILVWIHYHATALSTSAKKTLVLRMYFLINILTTNFTLVQTRLNANQSKLRANSKELKKRAPCRSTGFIIKRDKTTTDILHHRNYMKTLTLLSELAIFSYFAIMRMKLTWL